MTKRRAAITIAAVLSIAVGVILLFQVCGS